MRIEGGTSLNTEGSEHFSTRLLRALDLLFPFLLNCSPLGGHDILQVRVELEESGQIVFCLNFVSKATTNPRTDLLQVPRGDVGLCPPEEGLLVFRVSLEDFRGGRLGVVEIAPVEETLGQVQIEGDVLKEAVMERCLLPFCPAPPTRARPASPSISADPVGAGPLCTASQPP